MTWAVLVRKIAALGIAILGAIIALILVSLKWFHQGRLVGVLRQRDVDTALFLAALVTLAGLYLYLRPATLRMSLPRARRLQWRVSVPLIALILLAAFLRFYRLDFQSLWRDEIASVARMESPTLSAALMLGNYQDAWPSYHIPLYAFIRLAGDSEFAFRFPSALAGILLIPALFVLGRRMFSVREGLIAAGITVALHAPLWYSQEARSYSFLTLFAALSGYFWFRLAQAYVRGRAPGRLVLTGYVVTAILTAYAHYFGLLLVAVEALGVLVLMIHARRVPLPLVGSFAVVGIAYVPWLPLMVADLGKPSFWAGRPATFAGRLFGFFQFLFRSPLNFIVIGIMALAILQVLWRQYHRREEGRALPLAATPGIVLAAWLILPFGIVYWRSLVSTPILVDRYLLVCLPPAYLLLARAITCLPVTKIGQGIIGAGLVAFVMVRLAVSPYYTAPNKTELREAVGYIASHESRYPDAVIIGGYQGGRSELDYYFRKFGSSSTIDIKAGNAWEIDSVRQQLAERKPRYVWFLGQYLFYEKAFQDFLTQDFHLVAEVQYYHVKVLLFQNPAAGN